MNHKSLFAAAALFAACTPALPAQTASAPAASAPAVSAAAPVTLRYKFAVGQVHRFQLDMAMDMLMQTGQTGAGIPIAVTMQMTMRQTVKSIRSADGAATVVTQIESMHLLRGGQETPLPEAQQEKMKQPITQVMLPTGKVLSMDMPKFDGGMPGMDFGKGMFNSPAFLPDGPVKIGDTWNGTGTALMAGTDIAITSTLMGVDQTGGAALATIQSKQNGTIEKTMTQGLPAPMKMQGQVTGMGTQIFDTSAGALQNATGTSTTDMLMTFEPAADGTTPPGMPSAMKMQMQMKYTMKRLSDTSPSAAPLQ